MSNPAQKLLTSVALAGTLLGSPSCKEAPKKPVDDADCCKKEINIDSTSAIHLLQGKTLHHEGLSDLSRQVVDNEDTVALGFLNSTGKPANLSVIDSALRGKQSTLSTLFAGCGRTCPTTMIALSKLSRDFPNLKHVVVSILPESDMASDALINEIESHAGLRVRGDNPNVYVLFPTVRGKLSAQYLGALQTHNLNMFVGGTEPGAHSGETRIYLDGQRIGQFGVENPNTATPEEREEEAQKVYEGLKDIIVDPTHQPAKER